MQTYRLVPHLAFPTNTVRGVTTTVRMTDAGDVLVTFMVEGADRLKRAARQHPERTDDLWRTTCFEVFLKPDDQPNYFEFNLAPSTQWAAYRFADRRDGMQKLPLPIAPHIEVYPDSDDDRFELEADIDLSAISAERLWLGLSAVIEETDGTKSFWALAHTGERPDFHDPACFTARLGPAPPR